MSAAVKATTAARLTAALMYIGAAMSLNVVNKLVLSVYQFHSLFLLIFAQNFIAVVVCTVLKYGKLAEVPDLKDLFTAKNRGMFLVSGLNMMNILASFSGLQLVNIPVFLALRKLTTLVIVGIEVLFFAKWPSKQAFLAICLACAGGVYSGVANLDAEWFGYFYTLFSDVATALYIISLKRGTTLKSFGILYYNGVILCVPAFLLFVGSSQYNTFMHDFPSRTDPGFIVAFLISSMMGIVLTYAQINCTYVNDPTVTSVCGFFKDSFMIVLGLFLFGDVSFTPKLGFGLLAVISGGAWYTYNTVLERKAAARCKAAAAGGVELEEGRSLMGDNGVASQSPRQRGMEQSPRNEA